MGGSRRSRIPFLDRDRQGEVPPSQLVFVTVPRVAASTSDDGLTKDSSAVRRLGDQLRAAAGRLGVIRRIDVQASELTIYAEGPDADRLFAALRPVLAGSPLVPRAWVLLRYGGIGAREAQITM
jgi:hypothetical protein